MQYNYLRHEKKDWDKVIGHLKLEYARYEYFFLPFEHFKYNLINYFSFELKHETLLTHLPYLFKYLEV